MQNQNKIKNFDEYLVEKMSSGLKDQLAAKNPQHPFLKAFKDDEDFEKLRKMWDEGKREEAAREFRMRLVKSSNTKVGTALLLMVAGASITATGFNALETPPENPPVPAPTPPEPPSGEEYIIKKGDSIWKIAKSFLPDGASNEEIMAYTKQIASENGMNVDLIDSVLSKVPGDPDLIFPGGKLMINDFAGK
jgi:nucleoid-associated protein YgaU